MPYPGLQLHCLILHTGLILPVSKLTNFLELHSRKALLNALHCLQVHRYQHHSCVPLAATTIVHQAHSVEPVIGPRQPLQPQIRPLQPCNNPALEHHKELNHLIVSADSADAILQLVCEQVPSFTAALTTPYQSTSLAIAAACCHTTRHLHHPCAQGGDFNAVNAATALHRVAHFSPPRLQSLAPHPGFALLLKLVTAHTPHLRARELANVLWAFAHLQLPPSPHLGALLLAATGTQLRHFNPQGTANMLWALGKLGLQPPQPLLQGLLAALGPHLPHIKPQGLSNSVYGLALLGHDPGGRLMDTTAARLLEMIELGDEVRPAALPHSSLSLPLFHDACPLGTCCSACRTGVRQPILWWSDTPLPCRSVPA